MGYSEELILIQLFRASRVRIRHGSIPQLSRTVKTVMIEAGALQVSEDVVYSAIEEAHRKQKSNQGELRN